MRLQGQINKLFSDLGPLEIKHTLAMYVTKAMYTMSVLLIDRCRQVLQGCLSRIVYSSLSLR